MTHLVDNRELLEAFRAGERKALEDVYLQYFPDIVRFLEGGFSIKKGENHYHFKGYEHAWRLEGAVQEVFARAFSEKARLSYDGVRPYRNYLLMIARNYVINTFHKRSREFVAYDADDVENRSRLDDGEENGHSPEKVLADNQLKEHVNGFISRMSPEARQLFELRFASGLSIEKVAQTLGCSEYRVKRDEKRLRRDFFKEMKSLGYFEGYKLGDDNLDTLITTVFLAASGWGGGI